MTVPDFQSIMLPLLQFYSDNKDHSVQEAVDELAKYFDLSDQNLAAQGIYQIQQRVSSIGKVLV